jgi:hypothetical protein
LVLRDREGLTRYCPGQVTDEDDGARRTVARVRRTKPIVSAGCLEQ